MQGPDTSLEEAEVARNEGPGERAGFQALEWKVVGSTIRQAAGRQENVGHAEPTGFYCARSRARSESN